MKRGDLLELRIEKSVYGGDGLGREAGQAVFVPFTLPGELVTVTVTQAKSGFARAALCSIEELSPERAEPPCRHYGLCGGCHYQHAQYSAQVAIKAAVLGETLSRAQLGPLPSITTHAGEPLGYRNRIRLHLDPLSSALGYRERASHSLLAVEECPIAAPALQQALAALRPLCAAHASGRLFGEIELSVNHDSSELLMALILRPGAEARAAAAFLPGFCLSLAPLLPALRGAGIFAPPAAPAARKGGSADKDGQLESSTGEPGRLLASWGTPRMTYRAGGEQYQVSLGAFFQINRFLVDTLLHTATAGRQGTLAWDLYAGAGLFSRVLAQQYSRVVAVEGAPISAQDLRVNLPSPHRAVESGTVEFLRRAVAEARNSPKNPSPPRPDFVLVDPPRAGLGPEITTLLAQVGPPSVTYVSCDPATLARDLRALVASGYYIEQLRLIDLFPQTFHLEAVATLARG